MKEKLLALLKKPWAIVSAVIGLLLLVIDYLHKKNANLETDASIADTTKTQAVLAQKQSDLTEENKQAIAELEKSKGRSLTTDEMTDFLKGL